MHDHHIHLFATAAALESARCGPEDARDSAGLARALREHASDARGWVRGVGYHESVAGDVRPRCARCAARRRPGPRAAPQRPALDPELARRSNGSASIATGSTPSGVERDGAGRATGRVYRSDAWLRERLGPVEPPSLGEVSRRLRALGVTVVTDATAANGPVEVAAFAAARARGELSQRVIVMGTLALSDVAPPAGIEIGPVKIHLAEAELPDLGDVVETIRAAHARGRNAAIHAVTRVELVFALAAYEAAGVRAGDRLEHVHVAPPECVAAIARLGLTVCVNEALVQSRCEAWRHELDPRDRSLIGRPESFAPSGIALLSGSDAPYGPLCVPAAVGARPLRRA